MFNITNEEHYLNSVMKTNCLLTHYRVQLLYPEIEKVQRQPIVLLTLHN